jgi:hypothetical protein
MGKGRYLKSAERACASKARFETPQEAERTCEYRFRAYQCPVCHHYHLTSRAGNALSEPEPLPVRPEPKGPKLGDLDWSAALEPGRPKPPRPPKPVRPKPTPPPPPPPPRLARCAGPCGKDGRVPLVIDGRLVKSSRVPPPLRPKLARDVVVRLSPADPPEVLGIQS